MKVLYPNLSPTPRFLKILELHVLPQLEKDGFRLLKSGPSLKRVENGFEWLVEFDGRKFNSGDHICRFNPYFMVRNMAYRKFLKKNPELVRGWGTTGQVGSVSSIRHWDKSIFSADKSEAYFLEDNDFAKYDNQDLVDEMIKNIREVGVPYFRMMSNFDSIRSFYVKTEQRGKAPLLVDLCSIMNKEEHIESIFDWYYAANSQCADWLNKQMELRRK